MARYLVLVDPLLLSGAAAAQAAFAGPPPTATDALAARRAMLADLAQSLVGQPAAGGLAAMGASTALETLTRVARTTRAPAPAPAHAEILEGLGAVVLDDSVVDPATLRGVLGLEVIPDQILDAPPVLPASAAPPPARWHLGQTNAAASTLQDGAGTLVGVLDTGIALTRLAPDGSTVDHPEFVNKTVHFQEFGGAGQQIPGPARDAGQHGTHVCGLIAGNTCGVASGASLAVAAVLTLPGPNGLSGSLLQIANGFNWLLTHPFRPGIPGVDAINASLGAAGFNPFLRLAVQTALLAPGVLLVAAAGNAGRLGMGNHGSPGNYPETLAVGATDVNDRVADFSDWGTVTLPGLPVYTVPDLCAPGVDIFSSLPTGYGFMSGTSMATPIVTGFGARLLSTTPAHRANPAALRAAIEALASVPWAHGANLNEGGRGRIRG